jgi:hypothetical protein
MRVFKNLCILKRREIEMILVDVEREEKRE